MSKTALITGVSGQDGAYLANLLLDRGYTVYGAVRRSSSINTWRLDELNVTGEVQFVDFDSLEITNIIRTIERVRPDEIYNLAAQSHVALSFQYPIVTSDINGLGVARLLEAIRTVNPTARFYQASTSEMFGKAQTSPQTEATPFYPRSPYAVSKLYAHWLTVNYRESYGLFAACGILFNHESPLRGREFVTRKITSGLALAKHGKLDFLAVGNLEACRDWGFAGDYVVGMADMMLAAEASDFVLATGTTTSVRHFIELAAPHFGFQIDWVGQGVNEVGVDRVSNRKIIQIDPKYFRPTEVDALIGSSVMAAEKLGWHPRVKIDELVGMMAEADNRRVRNGAHLL